MFRLQIHIFNFKWDRKKKPTHVAFDISFYRVRMYLRIFLLLEFSTFHGKESKNSITKSEVFVARSRKVEMAVISQHTFLLLNSSVGGL